MPRARTAVLILELALGAVLASLVLAPKLGWWPPRPLTLAAVAAALVLLAAGELALALHAVARRRATALAGGARALVFAGVLAVLGGGFANWLLGLQGYVILLEGERVAVTGASQLEGFEVGPWADPRELRLALELVKVTLRPDGAGGVVPESSLRVWQAAGEPRDMRVRGAETVSLGDLRLHGGAFGYAPHIGLERDGQVIFDRVVPFTTARHRPGRYSFAGFFTIEKEALDIRAAVDLRSLDDELRGHPQLYLELRRQGGEVLGAGELRPGRAADVEGGYRVVFAGLEKWVEIDVSRRTYPAPMFAGASAMIVGLILGAGAWVARRRARGRRA